MKAVMRALIGTALVAVLGLPAAWGQQSETGQGLTETLNEALGAATEGQLQVDSVSETPLEGIMEVTLSSGEVLFSDPSGRFIITGDMLQAGPDGLVNLSAQTRRDQALEAVSSVAREEMITFSPDDVSATITVFTDVDCPYCRRLHDDIEAIMDRGIEVRYLAYPRGGREAESYQKMVSVWCADDRQRAITRAKNGQDLPPRDCDNPVLDHFELGNRVGITGTPAVVLENGRVLPGYMDVDRLTSAVLGE